MSWPRRTRDDREPETLRMPRSEDRYPPPHAYPGAYPGERRERRDSYWTFLVLGLAAPFGLAVFLYPLAWYPVWYVVLPIAGLIRRLLRTSAPAPPPPGGPMPWDLGPILTPSVAITWALALAAAWFVLSRLAGRRSHAYQDSPARRGFRAGLRTAMFAGVLITILWANRILAG